MAIVPPQENPLLSVTSAERATKILADIRTEVRSIKKLANLVSGEGPLPSFLAAL